MQEALDYVIVSRFKLLLVKKTWIDDHFCDRLNRQSVRIQLNRASRVDLDGMFGFKCSTVELRYLFINFFFGVLKK